MPTPTRDTTLTVRVSAEERRMLAQLAEEAGVSSSDIVRILVRREFAARTTGGAR